MFILPQVQVLNPTWIKGLEKVKLFHWASVCPAPQKVAGGFAVLKPTRNKHARGRKKDKAYSSKMDLQTAR